MFKSFDENAFWQAIKDKNYLRLKVSTVTSMWNDPTFELGEIDTIIQILKEQAPEIFEDYVIKDYEERLEREMWDKRYFTKLTYWFLKNFSVDRIEYIKEVGRVVHRDTYAKTNEIQSNPTPNTQASTTHKKTEHSAKPAPKDMPGNAVRGTSSKQHNPPSAKPNMKPLNNKKRNFPIAGVMVAVVALVIMGLLLVKFLAK